MKLTLHSTVNGEQSDPLTTDCICLSRNNGLLIIYEQPLYDRTVKTTILLQKDHAVIRRQAPYHTHLTIREGRTEPGVYATGIGSADVQIGGKKIRHATGKSGTTAHLHYELHGLAQQALQVILQIHITD